MTIRRRNPREQGEIGLADAIAWFAAQGHAVLVPLCDNQPYDLIVDDGERLARVQVKTATYRTRGGAFRAQIRTNGGNRTGYSSKPFDPAKADIVFILTDGGDRYVIPSCCITARADVTLGARYQEFRA
jgi:PD-(D/E)XK nuclease superfamily protein